MESSFPIGRRQCGEKKISVEVKYTIKARQINVSTFIYAVGVTLVDGNKNKDHCVLRFLVSISNHLRYSFITFLQRLIRTVLITDSVLYSIGAIDLIKLQNKIDQHDITVQEKAELNDLRKSMLSMGVTILEHDDIYHFSTSDYEPELAMYRYNNEDNYFISDEEFSCELASIDISAVPALHDENDVRIAKKRMLERRKKDLEIETTDKSKPSSSMLIKFCFRETLLHIIYNIIL